MANEAGTHTPRPAARATRSLATVSRARPQVSGAASDPIKMDGRDEARAVGPSSQMNGTCTIEASGAQ